MAYSSWKQLAEDVIVGLFRPSDRQKMRDLFGRHESIYGRAWGLRAKAAEEVGFHAVADYVRDNLHKDVLLNRDESGMPLGWNVEPLLEG